MVETRRQIRDRLTPHGDEVWYAYTVLRDSLKSRGHSPPRARQLAIADFPPDRYPLLDPGTNHDQAGGVSAPSLPEQEATHPGAANRGGEHSALVHPSASLPSIFLPRFVPRSVFEDKPASSLVEDIEWVASNMCIADVQPGDAPSSLAYGLLVLARSDRKEWSELYKNLLSRLLPTRRSLEDAEETEREGRDLVRTIKRLLDLNDAVLPPRPEGVQAEPEMAPQSHH